jgi:hypothetical protein
MPKKIDEPIYFKEVQGPFKEGSNWAVRTYYYNNEDFSGLPVKQTLEYVEAPVENKSYNINLKEFLLSLPREDRDNLGFYVANENPALKYILEDGKLTISEIDSIIEDFEGDSGTKIKPETAELVITRLNYIKSLIA